MQRIALSTAGHAARGLGKGSRSSTMTAVIRSVQQELTETVNHFIDDSSSEYFPTPKKEIVELPEVSEEEQEVPQIAIFY